MRIRRAPAARAAPASWSARSAACRSSASASCNRRSSAAGPKSSASATPASPRPKSIRFPQGRKAGGALTLLVEGAHAPLIQHLAPLIIERVNRFFGHAAIDRIVFRQGKPPAPPARIERPALRPVPKELGEGLREIADPELRACLESLASQIAASGGPPSLASDGDEPIPMIKPEQLTR